MEWISSRTGLRRKPVEALIYDCADCGHPSFLGECFIVDPPEEEKRAGVRPFYVCPECGSQRLELALDLGSEDGGPF